MPGFPAAGIAGGAWATFVAIAAKVVVYLVLLALPGNRRMFGSLDWQFDWPLLRRLLKFGGPAGLQMLLEVAGFTVFVFLVGSLGVKELAATNLAFNVSSLAFMPVFGLSTAVSILVGQHLGRNDPDLAARGTWTSLWLAMGYMVGVSTMYVLVPDLFLYGFFLGDPTTSGQEIRGIAIVLAAVRGGLQPVRCVEPGVRQRHQGSRRHAICVRDQPADGGRPGGRHVGRHGVSRRRSARLLGTGHRLGLDPGRGLSAAFLARPVAFDAGHRDRADAAGGLTGRGSPCLPPDLRGRYRIVFWEIVG